MQTRRSSLPAKTELRKGRCAAQATPKRRSWRKMRKITSSSCTGGDPRPSTPEEIIRRGLAAVDLSIDGALRGASDVVPNAMWREDLGPIAFYWGEPGVGNKFKSGSGLSHVIAKHGIQALEPMTETIANGVPQLTVRPNGAEQLIMEYNGNRVVLDPIRRNNHEVWLLTSFELAPKGIVNDMPTNLSILRGSIFYNIASMN